MEHTYSAGTSWRTSTNLIFWGILALTVFGCVASFCEFFFGPIDSLRGYIDKLLDVSLKFGDQSHAEGFYKFYAVRNTLAIWTRTAEILTIAGWVAYIVGLFKFRDAQPSEKCRRLAGSLYSACWLGLIGMACTFIGSFLGVLGMLFRFTGWLLELISLFKFRGAFNQLSFEDGWNNMAHHGARNLRSSYTFGIILAFYPIIVFLVALFIVAGYIGNFSDIASNFSNDLFTSIATLIGGSIAIVIILALAAAAMWICQSWLLISGWYKIKQATPTMDSEEEYHSDNSTLIIICSIIASILLMAVAVWTCIAPITKTNGNYYISETEIHETTEEDRELTTAPDNEKIISAETNEIGSPDASDQESTEYHDSGATTYTRTYQGTINNKYGIQMTLTSDGGRYYTGEYFYTKNKQPINLQGELTDDSEHLVLEEYVGTNMTGKFEGTLSGSSYRGTWTSADGERSYPFAVTIYPS